MRYRHGLETIEAFCWEGNDPVEPAWAVKALKTGLLKKRDGFLLVKTASGDAPAYTGDWIVRLPSGEIYPCTQAVFAKRCRATPRPPQRPDDRPRYSRAARSRARKATSTPGIAEQA
jgi:hypothetical protein